MRHLKGLAPLAAQIGLEPSRKHFPTSVQRLSAALSPSGPRRRRARCDRCPEGRRCSIDAGDHQNFAFLLIGAEDNSLARREEVRRCDKSQAGSPNLPIG
jgi:hypothetical protein